MSSSVFCDLALLIIKISQHVLFTLHPVFIPAASSFRQTFTRDSTQALKSFLRKVSARRISVTPGVILVDKDPVQNQISIYAGQLLVVMEAPSSLGRGDRGPVDACWWTCEARRDKGRPGWEGIKEGHEVESRGEREKGMMACARVSPSFVFHSARANTSLPLFSFISALQYDTARGSSAKNSSQLFVALCRRQQSSHLRSSSLLPLPRTSEASLEDAQDLVPSFSVGLMVQ